MFNIKRISDNLVWLDFDTQSHMNRTLIRFTEFVESPEFAGKIFTLPEYKKWYTETNGGWTYNKDWAGHNLTEKNLAPFLDGRFQNLTGGELAIIEIAKAMKSEVFSIIGTFGGGETVLYHEMTHALFHTNQKYHNKVMELLGSNHSELYFLRHFLKNLGYNESVHEDEINAYCCDRQIKLPQYDKDWKVHIDLSSLIDEDILNNLANLRNQYISSITG